MYNFTQKFIFLNLNLKIIQSQNARERQVAINGWLFNKQWSVSLLSLLSFCLYFSSRFSFASLFSCAAIRTFNNVNDTLPKIFV